MNVRIQEVETECARLRLQRMLHEIHKAAELAVRMGLPAALAIERGLRADRCSFAARKKPDSGQERMALR